MARRKKTRSLKTMSRTSVLAAERNHYGDEPDFTDSVELGCKRIRAFDKDGNPDPELAYLKSLNWYNACGDEKAYGKWLYEFAKEYLELTTTKAEPLKKLTKIDRTIAINARILLRGGDDLVPETKQKSIENLITAHLASIAKQKKIAKKSNTPKRPSVQDYMEQAADSFFGETVEPIIDELFATGGKKNKDHDLYALLTKAEISGLVALKVVNRIQPTIDELNSAYDKSDDDLVEGYSFITRPKIKKVRDALVAMCEDCERLNSVTKKTRKTTQRKKKKPTAAKLLDGFKYKEKDDEYKIASVDPKNVIGASSVVLFNIKTRKAAWICAEDRKGLNIKGASIAGYDEKKCVEKTIRKPFEFIGATNGKGKRAIKKAFDEINGKNLFTSGKANAHTIILTVVK